MRSTPTTPGSVGRGALSRAGVATFVLGLALTVVLCAGLRQAEAERTQADFTQRAAVRAAAVTRAFDEATDALRATNLFFQVSAQQAGAQHGEVSRAQFDAFAQPLIRRHGYLQALEYQRFVSAAERAAFEAERARLWPGFAIRERAPSGAGLVRAGGRARYLVNDYVVPIVGNEAVFGYDALSNPAQRGFSERAVDIGEPSASPLIDLVQGGWE